MLRHEIGISTGDFGKLGVRPPKHSPGIGRPSTIIQRVRAFVPYGLNSSPNSPVGFGTKSLPVPDISVSSVRTQQSPTARQIWHDVTTGAQHFGKFGIPTQIYPGYRYTLDHNTGGIGFCSVRPRYRGIGYSVARYGRIMTLSYGICGSAGTHTAAVHMWSLASVRIQE